MQEIDPELRWKRNNLPYYLAKRGEAPAGGGAS
jgi:hypothetical protein